MRMPNGCPGGSRFCVVEYLKGCAAVKMFPYFRRLTCIGSAVRASCHTRSISGTINVICDSMTAAHRVTTAPDLAAALAIRHTVFVLGQNVPAELEHDAHDQTDATHYLAVAPDGTPCGAARWRPTENGVKLERFAVLAEYRNQQVGAALLTAVLQDVQAAHPRAEVYLNAQVAAVRFYERHGFGKVGAAFWEAGIEHYKMIWQRP
jgi:predicted GNAT family N-acyltransferase